MSVGWSLRRPWSLAWGSKRGNSGKEVSPGPLATMSQSSGSPTRWVWWLEQFVQEAWESSHQNPACPLHGTPHPSLPWKGGFSGPPKAYNWVTVNSGLGLYVFPHTPIQTVLWCTQWPSGTLERHIHPLPLTFQSDNSGREAVKENIQNVLGPCLPHFKPSKPWSYVWDLEGQFRWKRPSCQRLNIVSHLCLGHAVPPFNMKQEQWLA